MREGFKIREKVERDILNYSFEAEAESKLEGKSCCGQHEEEEEIEPLDLVTAMKLLAKEEAQLEEEIELIEKALEGKRVALEKHANDNGKGSRKVPRKRA